MATAYVPLYYCGLRIKRLAAAGFYLLKKEEKE